MGKYCAADPTGCLLLHRPSGALPPTSNDLMCRDLEIQSQTQTHKKRSRTTSKAKQKIFAQEIFIKTNYI